MISSARLAYMNVRNRMHAFTLVHKELKKAGITYVEVAERLGRPEDEIRSLLGAPGNRTLDTPSELLWAISKSEIDYQIAYPVKLAEVVMCETEK